ncbi:MAG: rod shape-determining protein [Thermodesulfobacteriota bacterium]|nr:rod shape-determining protein [Thermodesulfobacteriota bacterium]
MFSILKQIIKQPCIAVDLGTANTRVYSSELGQIREKTSVIPQVTDSKKTVVSDEYLSYLNSKLVAMPLRGGVIVDLKKAITLLQPLLSETKKVLRHPIALASAPTDTSDKERELLARAVRHAGASHVAIVPEVWAAAIGAGIDVTLPYAQVLIDIGEGVTDMAVIRDSRLVCASAVRTACSDLQKAIRSTIMVKHKVYLYLAEVERLTHEISSMSEGQAFSPKMITVSGMDTIKRCKVTIDVNKQNIIDAMSPVVHTILRMIEGGLKKLTKTTSGEVLESGICLNGGGACINGIDRLIASRTNLDVKIAPDPMHSVINGEIATLDYWKEHQGWWKNIVWPQLS